MDHRWDNELGTRSVKVDLCGVCGAARLKATKGGITYVDGHGNMSGEMPSCKQNDEKRPKGDLV